MAVALRDGLFVVLTPFSYFHGIHNQSLRFMDYTLVGFLFYLVLVLGVGIITYRINRSHQDFFLAGRKLSPWVVAFSERASGESAWLILGLPGVAFAAGLLEIWTAVGCVLGILIYWYVIARGLREQSEQFHSITLPEFFASKLGGGKNLIRIAATLIILFFFSFYLAAQFNGAGKVLDVTFGIPPLWGIVIGSLVIILYTMMGGFFAVAWTDLIQGIIMIGALVILPLAGLIELHQNGLSLASALQSAPPEYSGLTGGTTGWAAAATVIGGLSWMFGYMGQPHLLTRFMSIKDPARIRISRRIALAWSVPAFAGAILIGLVGWTMDIRVVQEVTDPVSQIADKEFIMPFLTSRLFPAWLAGIFISGAIAAIMSTADSQLLVISSSVIEDFYHRTLGKELTGKRLLFLSRAVTLLVGLAALVLAITSDKFIFGMVSYAWSGLGASFGPALLLLLYWKRIHWKGVLAGMITGTAVTIVWTEIEMLDQAVSARFVSFVAAFLAVVAVSLWAGTPQEPGTRNRQAA